MDPSRSTLPVVIRRGTPPDAAALAAFATRTFDETFGPDNHPDDMAAFLSSTYGVRQQSEELANPDIITLLAESDEGLAGYAQVRRGVPPACVTGQASMELWRFYVDRPWQGRGLARRLMAAAHAAAQELGGRTLWLGVWERNGRARAFYEKCGFRAVGIHSFWVGSDEQTDVIMIAEIAPRDAHGG